MTPILVMVCWLTFFHFVAAHMRSPIVPLYAVAHGATATGVGVIVSAHMAAAALGSVVLGRASDVWGCRPLLLGGMALGAATSLLLPLVQDEVGLAVLYGLAGLGVAAFTPSALSVVGEAAPPSRTGQAFAWYATAHYAAIGVGPFVGGLVAEWVGYRWTFVVSAAGMAVALVAGVAMPIRTLAAPADASVTFAAIRGNPVIWAGFTVSMAGMLTQGVVFTFLPLLGLERGLGPSAIGFVFLVLGLANTLARYPAGWLVDRTGRCPLYALGGVLASSLVTVALPHVAGHGALLLVAALFGIINGLALVAVAVELARAAVPAARGLVMGAYSTALYLGLALGSFGLGPVITHQGYGVGFAVGGAAGIVGTACAAGLWSLALRARGRQVVGCGVRHRTAVN
jgi:predicted MFS family arabinose efflux permease